MDALGWSRRGMAAGGVVAAALALLWARSAWQGDRAEPTAAGGDTGRPVFAVSAVPTAPSGASTAVFHAAPVEVPAVRVTLASIAVDPGGRWVAQLRVDDGPPRAALVGDAVSIGVRVQRIDAQGVDLQIASRIEHLPLPPGIVPPRSPALADRQRIAEPSVITVPAGQAPPSSTAVDRAIQRALVRGTGG